MNLKKNCITVTTLILQSVLLFTLPCSASTILTDTPRISTDSIQHPTVKNRFVYFFHSTEIDSGMPVVFFCHGVGASNPDSYGALIRHLVNRGFAVVYSPYDRSEAMFTPVKAYREIWDGFVYGADTWKWRLDLSRIGIVGHSFGGGAVPYMARRAADEKHWGRNGTMLFIMAPWYTQGLSQKQLRMPIRNCSVTIQVFEDDVINDPRMACDLFKNLNVPPQHKRFITVHSSRHNGSVLSADHELPMGSSSADPLVNALDSFALYHQIDLQAAMLWDKPEHCPAQPWSVYDNGSDTVMNQGTNAAQTFCELSAGVNTCRPKPQSVYVNFWSHAMNPRSRPGRMLGRYSNLIAWTPCTIVKYCGVATRIGLRTMSRQPG